MTARPRNQIVVGDALQTLAKLDAAWIDTCVTSPPYFQLRDYGTRGQLGLEGTVDEWVADLVAVGRELRRVLVPTGSWWLNLGDSFSRHARYGAAPKSLLLAPERLALALSADGWLVRAKVIWAKTNPMPTSVPDRLATTYEVVYHFTVAPRYYFDLDVVREPHQSRLVRKKAGIARIEQWRGPLAGKHDGLARARNGVPGHPLGKNPGDVWRLATRGHSDHHAAFPGELVRRPIIATCPERVCLKCAAPWQRARRRDALGEVVAACRCNAGTRAGIVLDPFFGTGTVGIVAMGLGRDYLGIELNPTYAALAASRLGEGVRYERPLPMLARAA